MGICPKEFAHLTSFFACFLWVLNEKNVVTDPFVFLLDPNRLKMEKRKRHKKVEDETSPLLLTPDDEDDNDSLSSILSGSKGRHDPHFDPANPAIYWQRYLQLL